MVLVSLSPMEAQADADHAGIAKASLEQYIRPGYAQFAGSMDALKQSVAALCGKRSPAALKDTQDAFAVTVEAWSVVEPIRFGPVAQEHRFERIFYWPDPKGLGTRQIREVLAKQDKSVTEQTGLVGKSVALQGLPALEYLLYGDGAATLEKGGAEGTFRCSFAEAAAGNLASIGKEIVDGWQDGAPYAKSYLEPGPANPALSHGERGDARAVQDLHRRDRVGARPEIGKDARAKAGAGKAAVCAVLAERAELRQRGR
jgi:predicted lipoprotein